jgi:hypothetical protein
MWGRGRHVERETCKKFSLPPMSLQSILGDTHVHIIKMDDIIEMFQV